jgi:hypothetical protein
MAGSLPSADTDLLLPPGRSAHLLQETTLNFSAKGQPVNVSKMVGLVNQLASPIDSRLI